MWTLESEYSEHKGLKELQNMDLLQVWSIIHNGLCEMEEETENSELQKSFSKKQTKKQNNKKKHLFKKLVIKKIQLKRHTGIPLLNHKHT